MKVIIPFKFDSSRCRKKNVREFFDRKSLLDITVENFLRYDHHVSLVCVDGTQTDQLIKKYGVNHIPLNNTSNNWSEVVIDLSQSLINVLDLMSLFVYGNVSHHYFGCITISNILYLLAKIR